MQFVRASTRVHRMYVSARMQKNGNMWNLWTNTKSVSTHRFTRCLHFASYRLLSVRTHLNTQSIAIVYLIRCRWKTQSIWVSMARGQCFFNRAKYKHAINVRWKFRHRRRCLALKCRCIVLACVSHKFGFSSIELLLSLFFFYIAVEEKWVDCCFFLAFCNFKSCDRCAKQLEMCVHTHKKKTNCAHDL